MVYRFRITVLKFKDLVNSLDLRFHMRARSAAFAGRFFCLVALLVALVLQLADFHGFPKVTLSKKKTLDVFFHFRIAQFILLNLLLLFWVDLQIFRAGILRAADVLFDCNLKSHWFWSRSCSFKLHINTIIKQTRNLASFV